jgi:hypothetical protein
VCRYLFEEQQRVFMETMASVNMHKADRKHIHKFAPKNSTRRMSEEEQAAEKSKSEQKEGEKGSFKHPWVSVTKSLIHLKRGARVMNHEDEEDDTEGKPETVKKSSMLAEVTTYLVSIFIVSPVPPRPNGSDHRNRPWPGHRFRTCRCAAPRNATRTLGVVLQVVGEQWAPRCCCGRHVGGKAPREAKSRIDNCRKGEHEVK